MAETSIEWTDATWNPVAGCTILTAGCTNCYSSSANSGMEPKSVFENTSLVGGGSSYNSRQAVPKTLSRRFSFGPTPLNFRASCLVTS